MLSLDVLFEGWRPMVGDNSFIFSTELDIFSRREKLDFVVDTRAKQCFGNIFANVSIFRNISNLN